MNTGRDWIQAMTASKDVDEFLHKFGLNYKGPRRMLPPSLSTHRIAHMTEELEEYITASSKEEKLDALIDLVYLAVGTALLHGFDFDGAWKEVHKANMEKVRGYNPDQRKLGIVRHSQTPTWLYLHLCSLGRWQDQVFNLRAPLIG